MLTLLAQSPYLQDDSYTANSNVYFTEIVELSVAQFTTKSMGGLQLAHIRLTTNKIMRYQ